MTDYGTQLLPAFLWRDPRVHPLDDTWLLTIFTILPAIVLPWLISGLEIDFAATAVGLLTLGAIHVGFVAMSSGTVRNPIRRTRTLSALHALGVITVAFIWQHAGGVHNPLFLMVFALPVIGATFLSRWQPYLVATLAAVLVALLASSQAPELRWYVPAGLSAAADWLCAARRCGPRCWNNYRCRQYCWIPIRMKSFVQARPQWRSFSALKSRSLVATSSRRFTSPTRRRSSS